MSILSREQIFKAADKVRNGTIARITYKTELPLKASFKKQGYKIIKITETSARLGVNYEHIASVIARKVSMENNNVETPQRKNNYTWELKNKIKYNSNTDKEYLVIANFNAGHHTKQKFVVIQHKENLSQCTEDIGSTLSEKYSDFLIDSYKKPTIAHEIKTISFDNLIRINDTGEKIVFDNEIEDIYALL